MFFRTTRGLLRTITKRNASGTKLLLLHGSVHVRLVPSEPEGAFVGAWGAAVAAESALMEPQWVELTVGETQLEGIAGG